MAGACCRFNRACWVGSWADDRLEMQPADVLRADLLPAVARALGRYDGGLVAAGPDEKLLVTAALERRSNQPPSRHPNGAQIVRASVDSRSFLGRLISQPPACGQRRIADGLSLSVFIVGPLEGRVCNPQCLGAPSFRWAGALMRRDGHIPVMQGLMPKPIPIRASDGDRASLGVAVVGRTAVGNECAALVADFHRRQDVAIRRALNPFESQGLHWRNAALKAWPLGSTSKRHH